MGFLVQRAEMSGFRAEERHYDGRVAEVRDVVVVAEAPLHGLEDGSTFWRWEGDVYGSRLVICAVGVEGKTPAAFLFCG